jgi:autotransporter-associated beta strand protein
MPACLSLVTGAAILEDHSKGSSNLVWKKTARFVKHNFNRRWLVLALAGALGFQTEGGAATVSKTNNAANLNLGSSWVGNTPPGSGDIAQWSSVVTGANTVGLGADLNWSGIKIAAPGGPVTLNAGNTLTLGGSGVDLSTATQDLTANCDLALGASQSWSVASGRSFTVGGGVSGTASLTLPGSGTVTFNGGSYSFGTSAVGNNALALNGGTLVMAGGTMNLAGNGDDAAHIQGSATFKQTGGVVNSSFYTRVGSTDRGTLVVSGGQFNNSGEILFAFAGSGPQGILVVSNTGTLNAHVLRAGNNGPCAVNLDGGRLITDLIRSPAAQGYFYFNGGTLQANTAPGNPWFDATMVAYVKNGGAIIDTAGQNVTFAANLQPSGAATGGLTKTGPGALTLAGKGTYNGPTTVSNGTLVITGGLISTGAVTVVNGATLGAGQMTNGSLTLSPDSTLALTLGAAGSPANSSLRVNGNLVLDGNVSITDAGGMSTGAVYSVIHYTGALTDSGLVVALNSAWDMTVDTSVTNFVRLTATRKFPVIEIPSGDLAVTSLYTNLSAIIHGVTPHPIWYEVRSNSPSGILTDFGAHVPSTIWPFTVRHLKAGTNWVTIFARDSYGQTFSNSIRLVLNLPTNTPVRPRPIPAEMWWGGLSENQQLLDPARPWDFVKQYQDGIFFHTAGYGGLTGTDMVNLATIMRPHNTKYWSELGGGLAGLTPGPDFVNNIGNVWGVGVVNQLQSYGLVMSQLTHDYHMEDMRQVCQAHPDWTTNNLVAWWTGDMSVTNTGYPNTSGLWRDIFNIDYANNPHLKIGETSQPEYWPWDGYPAMLGNQLSFTVTNPTTAFSFNAKDIIGSFINMASAIGHPYFSLQSDAPWEYFGGLGVGTAAEEATMRLKIRVYEQYLRSRGARHSLICNAASAQAQPGDNDAQDLYYKTGSLNSMFLHQQEGGRANVYLFESWYADFDPTTYRIPHTAAPETKNGSYANLALAAIQHLKGVKTNGTLEQLALGILSAGATNQISLTNNGDVACLPAIVVEETGSPYLVARYFNSLGQDITEPILSAEGYSHTNLLAPGQSFMFTVVVGAWAGAAPTATRAFTFEAFWNPQDPTGVVRDRKTIIVSADGLSAITNLIFNGSFTASAAAFVTWPGYAGGGANPASIAGWSNIAGSGVGLNGAAVGPAVGNPFSPTNAGGRTYAFIQGGPNGLTQTLSLSPNTTYQLAYDVAVRVNNTASYKVEVSDNTQTYFTTGTMPGSSAAFVRFTNTFTTPGTLSDGRAIKLWNLTPGDNTVDFANVSLIPLWTNSPTTTDLTTSPNPSLPGTNVIFTAAVSAPGGGAPTNAVRFRTNGIAAALVSLSASAQAAFATSLLPHGSNVITAEYVGDGNFLASTGSVVQLVNTPPAANAPTLGAVSGLPATLPITGGTNVTDADGDLLTVTAVSAPAHGIAGTDGTSATYTATSNYAGADSFNYTVSDIYGGAATNTVTVSVIASSANLNRMSVGLSGGNVVLTYLGVPWNNYALEQTFSLAPLVWLPVVTNRAAANGYLLFANPPAPAANSFWRIRSVP